MGSHPSITATQFPAQGAHLGLRVRLCYHYDPTQVHYGTCVRDDSEPPYVKAFQLRDPPRLVLATECHYSPCTALEPAPVAPGPNWPVTVQGDSLVLTPRDQQDTDKNG